MAAYLVVWECVVEQWLGVHCVWECVVEQWLGVHCVWECVVEQWLGVRRVLSNKRVCYYSAHDTHLATAPQHSPTQQSLITQHTTHT